VSAGGPAWLLGNVFVFILTVIESAMRKIISSKSVRKTTDYPRRKNNREGGSGNLITKVYKG
jgi:hypothetical protein